MRVAGEEGWGEEGWGEEGWGACLRWTSILSRADSALRHILLQ